MFLLWERNLRSKGEDININVSSASNIMYSFIFIYSVHTVIEVAKSIDVAMDDANFCLEKLPDGSGLKRNHAYYYQVYMYLAVIQSCTCRYFITTITYLQVQAQLLCTGSKYCDFIVYSNKTFTYVE